MVLNKDVDTVYDAKGCPECTQGYHGRIAIEEVLYISDELKATLANPKTTKDELKKMVYTDDVTTLLGDGLEKIINGDTSFEEIFKLIEVDLEIQTIREESIERSERRERNISNKGNLLGNLIIEAPESEAAPVENNNTDPTTEESDEYNGTANVVIPSTANIIIQAPPNANLGSQLSIPTGEDTTTAAPEAPKDATAIDIPAGDSTTQTAPVQTQEPVATTPEAPAPEVSVTAETPNAEENVVSEAPTPTQETVQVQEPIATTPEVPAIPETNATPEVPAQETVQTQETNPGFIDIPADTPLPEVPKTEENTTPEVPTPTQETVQTQEPAPGATDIPANTTVPEAVSVQPETEVIDVPVETPVQTQEPEIINIPTAPETTTEEIINTVEEKTDTTPTPVEEQQTGNLLFQNSVTEEPVQEQQPEPEPSINRLFGTPMVETPETNTDETTTNSIFGNEPTETNTTKEIAVENNENTPQVEPIDTNIIDNINLNDSTEVDTDLDLNLEPEPDSETLQPIQQNNNDQEKDHRSKAFDYLFKYLENEVVNAKDDEFDDNDEDDGNAPQLNRFIPDTIKTDPLDSYFINNNQ